MNPGNFGEEPRFRTIGGVRLVEVGKFVEEIRRIVGFHELIGMVPKGHGA